MRSSDSHLIALSDLHLGYDLSLANSESAQGRIVDQIAELCGGSADRLVLDGDCFEACVPRDAGRLDEHGLPRAVGEASRSFFRIFSEKIRCPSVTIAWGNHDYCLWRRIAAACRIDPFTNHSKGDAVLASEGYILPGAASFLSGLFGEALSQFSRIRSAYPNYVLGRSWPYIVFHHGHFLDDLVLGRQEDVVYLGLKILIGESRPNVIVGGDETVRSLFRKTESFVVDMWRYDSPMREFEWAIIRRGSKAKPCPSYPKDGLPVEILSEVQDDRLGRYMRWYLDVLLSDPSTPAPLGDRTKPSYLFLGHDHGGGISEISGMDGMPWRTMNLGGWTSEGGRTDVHSHALVWRKGAAAPSMHCLSI